MTYRFHVLGLAHTISTPEYSNCAFTQKIVKLCRMLKLRGHHVIHYGHQDSEVECDEHVTVVKRYDLYKSYKDHDWRVHGWPKFDIHNDWAFQQFNRRAIYEIGERKEPNDFLLCTFPHKPLADANSDMIVVEAGIGYPSGTFAPFRVFESYAVMHAYQGNKAVEWASNDQWYDVVIPNYFDPDQFWFANAKEDYLLFLARVNSGKGIHIAEQIASATDMRLIVAGGGEFEFTRGAKIERVGIVGPRKRAELLTGAKATLCPSTFLEPFCGTQVESFLSGTPVVSSDRGAFAEYNLHGVTGYRCKTFEQFVWATRNVGRINSAACREWGLRFSLDNVSRMYDEYWRSLMAIRTGEGWYADRSDRTDLDCTTNLPPVFSPRDDDRPDGSTGKLETPEAQKPAKDRKRRR